MKKGWIVCLCVPLLVAGCTIAPPASPPADGQQAWKAHRQRVAAVVRWTVTGRVALITAEEGWHGTLRWRQSQDGYEIRIIAPFGQGTVVLRDDPGGALLRSSRLPEPVTASDPEALLRQQLGWRVPVDGLRYWVRGLPGPDAPYDLSLDPHGRLQSLQQSGWRVRVLGYRRVGDYQLPQKIFLDNGRFQVRLAVEQWHLGG